MIWPYASSDIPKLIHTHRKNFASCHGTGNARNFRRRWSGLTFLQYFIPRKIKKRLDLCTLYKISHRWVFYLSYKDSGTKLSGLCNYIWQFFLDKTTPINFFKGRICPQKKSRAKWPNYGGNHPTFFTMANDSPLIIWARGMY